MITFKDFRQQLKEMSMIIPKMDDHKLNTKIGNTAEYQLYKSSIELEEVINKDINLYCGDYNKSGVYLAANPNKEQIVYFMKYKRDISSVIGPFVKQSWLWMDKSYSKEIGHLPSKMFFSLIDDYFTIATDSDQTPDGKQFWIKRLHDAFNKNLNVYYFNEDTEELLQLHKPSEIEEFDKKYNIWTEQESSWSKFFVISKKKLLR